ncbi:MAG: hypothetical protein ABIE07_06040 [Candidatus Zixiibacteriota bacterium]
MWKNAFYYKLFILACLGVVIYLTGGCTEKITNTSAVNYASVNIKAQLSSSKISALVTHGLLTVEARDIDSILVDTLEYIDGFMMGEIEVPAGLNRLFKIHIYNVANVELYQGSTVTDILPDSDIELPIQLRPARPMLNFSPHYGEVIMGDSVIIDINLFNIQSLGDISLELIVSQTGSMYIEYTIKGITLCDSCYTWHEGTAIGAYTLAAPPQSLTDANGDAQMARSIFRTYADWLPDTATVKITAVIQYMYKNTGQDVLDSIPVNSVYVDESEIFLIAPQVE